MEALEEVLGIPLFDRTTTPTTLTRYGERFEPYARHVPSMLTKAHHELSAATPTTDNTLMVVSLHTLSVNILSGMINYLRQGEPQLNFTINASIQGIDNHLNVLVSRQIDLLVTYDSSSTRPGLEIAGGLRRSLWQYERLILVISAQLADVLNGLHAPIPWLCYSDYTFIRCIVESAERRVRLRLKKVFESGPGETIRGVVLHHMGIAWLPESMMAEELVNQQTIHCWSENTDLVCEIPVVVWTNLEDQRAVA